MGDHRDVRRRCTREAAENGSSADVLAGCAALAHKQSPQIQTWILPVRFAVQGQYMPIHPNSFGQKWNIQVTVAPVIPKLIKGDILE